jgi:hypothetical protein
MTTWQGHTHPSHPPPPASTPARHPSPLPSRPPATQAAHRAPRLSWPQADAALPHTLLVLSHPPAAIARARRRTVMTSLTGPVESAVSDQLVAMANGDAAAVAAAVAAVRADASPDVCAAALRPLTGLAWTRTWWIVRCVPAVC